MSSPITIMIPARLHATRLPNKPILPIQGVPMIVRVWQQAQKADLGPVYVACDGEEIASLVRTHGGQAIVTDPALPRGTDRIHAALLQIESASDIIVNLQGDLPFIDPHHIQAALKPLEHPDFHMATLGAPIHDQEEWTRPQVVKAMTKSHHKDILEAYDFQRTDPLEKRDHAYHHIGIYVFRRASLERFVKLPESVREQERSLEQMRALDNNMRIGLSLVPRTPLAIDTPEDWERAQLM